MAEKPGAKPPKAGFHEEFGWFIWGFVVIAVLWFVTGGVQRQSSHEGAYLKPPAPLDSGHVYGKYYAGSDGVGKTKLDLPEAPSIFLRNTISNIEGFFISAPKQTGTIQINSLLSKKIFIDGIAGVKNTDPNTEYLRIVANEHIQTPVTVTGLRLSGNRLDSYVAIPKAVDLLTLGIADLKSSVILPENGRALITSARSPVGTSFRVNMCTGYLDQFQSYTPDLKKECPFPIDELKRIGPNTEQACIALVKKISRCTLYQEKFPADVSAACETGVAARRWPAAWPRRF